MACPPTPGAAVLRFVIEDPINGTRTIACWELPNADYLASNPDGTPPRASWLNAIEYATSYSPCTDCAGPT